MVHRHGTPERTLGARLGEELADLDQPVRLPQAGRLRRDVVLLPLPVLEQGARLVVLPGHALAVLLGRGFVDGTEIAHVRLGWERRDGMVFWRRQLSGFRAIRDLPVLPLFGARPPCCFARPMSHRVDPPAGLGGGRDGRRVCAVGRPGCEVGQGEGAPVVYLILVWHLWTPDTGPKLSHLSGLDATDIRCRNQYKQKSTLSL